MCLKGFVTAAFGSSEPFYCGKWACPVGAIPRESTDSLISLPRYIRRGRALYACAVF